MNSLTQHNLDLASEGALDYASLPPEALADLALQQSSPDAATSALGELTQRRVPEIVVNVAAEILQRPRWDDHLTAYAVAVLFPRDNPAGLKAMIRLLEMKPSETIAEELIDNVLSEPRLFESGEGHRFVVALARYLVDQTWREIDGERVAEVVALALP